MKNRPASRLLTFCILLTASSMPVSCSDPPVPPVDPESAVEDTLLKWQTYMESSAIGLWEGREDHRVVIDRRWEIGSDELAEPLFYDGYFIDTSGDTIVIADLATQSLVCIDSTGALLWRAGGEGEGPGNFLEIGQMSIGDSAIAVVNSGMSYVDIYSRDGRFLRRLSSVRNPQCVRYAGDYGLAVLSKRQPGGDVHIVDVDADSILFSLGEAAWEPGNEGNWSVYDLWCDFFPPDHLVYISQFECKVIICDLSDRTSVCVPTREFPFAVTEPEIEVTGGSMSGVYYPLLRSVFMGPEGEINFAVTNIMADGRMFGSSSTERRSPVALLDRYSLSGEYLGTWCLPDSSLLNISCNGDGYLAAMQYSTGMLINYELRGR